MRVINVCPKVAIIETKNIGNQSQHAWNISPVSTAATSTSVSSYKTF
jgi:hypothetical protein